MGLFGKIGRAFRNVGGIFQKGARNIGSFVKTAGSEIKGAVTRSAEGIGAGLGGLAGAALAVESGPAGMLVASKIGSEIGKRTAQQAGKLTAPKRELITTKPFPPPQNVRPLLGANGAGQYRGNPLEKSKSEKMGNFV